ncbi:MAG: hypothetical protein WDN69_24790 [Aliidongia sp.]
MKEDADMGRHRLVATGAGQHMLHEADCVSGKQAARIGHRLAEAMVEEAASKAHRVGDATRAEATMFDEIRLEVRQQRRTRDLSRGQRHRLRHADIDQMLGKPPRDRDEAYPVWRPLREVPRQSLNAFEGQGRWRDTRLVQQCAEPPRQAPVSYDRPRRVILGGIALLERVQVRLDAGFQIFGHNLGAPCCRSGKDYAEWAGRDHAASRTFSAARGIIRIAALCDWQAVRCQFIGSK